jgi:flavin-dependent thymidylate synthase
MKIKGQIQVELQEVMGSDRSISEMAWTSSTTYQAKKSKTDEDVSRVVNMLADCKHSTPFEGVVLRYWIKMPIFADRQHMTHRLQSASGQSARYRTMPSEWLSLPNDVQGILAKGTTFPEFRTYRYEAICKEANEYYNTMLKEMREAEKKGNITNEEYKRAREVLRGVLPQSNMTERVSIFNLRSFANYQKLRNSPHAQPEIRIVAELMLEELEEKNVCPVALQALKRNNWNI